LSLNRMKLSYVNMTEVVDHYFPPVGTLVKGGGEDYTDFKYWRDTPLELDEFSASDSDADADDGGDDDDHESQYAEDDDEEEVGDGLVDSYISRGSLDYGEGSLGESYDEDRLMGSMMEDEYADDEDGELDEEDEEELEADAARLPTPLDRTGKNATGETVHDLNAELITGVKNLKVEKK
jgi:phosphatidate phosphatase LPIN